MTAGRVPKPPTGPVPGVVDEDGDNGGPSWPAVVLVVVVVGALIAAVIIGAVRLLARV